MSAHLEKRPQVALAIRLPLARPEVSPEALLAAICLYFVVACNVTFWQSVAGHQASPGLIASLAVAVFALHALLIGSIAVGRATQPVLAGLLLVTAFATYYMTRYAVLFDVEMIHNVLKTDLAESRELVSVGMVLHVLVYGVVPAALVCWLRIAPRSIRAGAARRSIFLGAMAALAVIALVISSQGIFALMRNDHALRYQITPGNYIVSLVRALTEQGDVAPSARLKMAEDAHIPASQQVRKPRLLVLVVGETARAQNWGLNGYHRQTTPALAGRDVINFSEVQACGTSTEVSLPCMFSVFGRSNYDKHAIRDHESLLDVLARAGVSVQWRDNQSGCKGVCDGVGIERMDAAIDPGQCANGRCMDDILLTGLASRIEATKGDLAVVLHQLGNHGPNYFERYPAQYETYTPTCRTPELSRCTGEQIVNAYDNAITYTDAFLSRALDIVQQQTSHEGAFLYVSDHGESLGEYGLYLHGAPYAIAPQQQLHVPMVMWLSPELASDTGVDVPCLRAGASRARSHDNLFHSVLGLFGVQTHAYESGKDIFAPCQIKA